MLIRKKLTAAEFSNPALRYDPTCDCVQFTPDEGETWIDQPANDPRTSDAYRLPALTGDDTQCRAAEGMTALIRAIVDQRIQFDTDAELAAAILGIVAFIPGFNVLYAILLAFVGLAVTIARELLEAAFTEPTYDQLRCIFYCNIDGDGQMSQEQFDQVIVEIGDLNALAEVWVLNVMLMVGPVGMSDAGVALEAAADCDECECAWCYEYDFTVDDWGFEMDSAVGNNCGSYSPGNGWQSGSFNLPSPGNRGVYIRKLFGMTLNLTNAAFEYSATAPVTSSVLALTDGSYGTLGVSVVGATTPTGSNSTAWASGVQGIRLQVGNCASCSPDGNAYITKMILNGIGEPPPDGVECPP